MVLICVSCFGNFGNTTRWRVGGLIVVRIALHDVEPLSSNNGFIDVTTLLFPNSFSRPGKFQKENVENSIIVSAKHSSFMF